MGLLSGALLTATAPSAADAWRQCIDNTMTNTEWGACGGFYLKRLDDELNTTWKKANTSLEDQQSRTQLLEEQRSWIKFRDASCQFYANGSFGREGQVLHFFACRGAIIEARITDLKSIYELTHQDAR
jgi:uncharacterized protein YecT (DUF1311 family)